MFCPVLLALAVAAGPSPSRTPCEWKVVDGVKIPVPPPEHPRLYLRAPDVAELPARLAAPALAPVVERLLKNAARNPQRQLEWDALQYLIKPERPAGREIVERALAMLKAAELPDVHDACRVTGRWMNTGAMVYDWLYPLLSDADKRAFRDELVRLAKTQEVGYPPTRQGSVTGHGSEAQIMREMLAAGIAMYDEFPEMYDLAATRFFSQHLPARNWLYNGHAYHQGDSYGPYRYSWDTFPLWIFDRLGAGNVYNPEQRFVPYSWIYMTRPDGQRLRSGDTYSVSAPRGKPWGVGLGACLTASYYGDGTLLAEHLKQGGVGESELLFELLWRAPDLEPQPLEALPLSHYMPGPFGWMVARTGWDANSVICEMKVNETNFTNHQHLDAGAFQIYHRGALAIDSGVYDSYGTEHGRNYYWRTVAHNCLLIHDPDEGFRDWDNDGGQRLPNGRSEPRNLEVLLDPQNGYRTGKVLAHGYGPDAQRPDYTWLQGDITAAYSGKVKQVVRSFAFLNLGDAKVPAALVVCDRVVAADPTFPKTWLLHTQERPTIDGLSAVVDRTEHDEDGRLVLDVLRPTGAKVEAVGGPGKEFWSAGRNHPITTEPERLAKGSYEPGAWRIEVSPAAAAAEDVFLTVMQITDTTRQGRLPVERLDGDGITGCALQADGVTWAVIFRTDAGRSAGPVRFTVPGDGTMKCLVTGLQAGAWTATRDGQRQALRAGDDDGAVWLAGPVGAWTMELEP